MKKGRSKRVFDYVRRSVSGRKRNRDDEIGGQEAQKCQDKELALSPRKKGGKTCEHRSVDTEAKDIKYKELAVPPRNQCFKHLDGTFTVVNFSGNALINWH